jgi:excisionase family DNA binding protein
MRDMSETPDTQKDLLSTEEIAEYLGVGLVTVYRWCKEGSLRCIKLGKHWRIRREALEDFLKQRERPAKLSGELRSFLSTLPAHIAIVDSSGTIVAVNQAWQDFATSNGAIVSKITEGTNYFEVCDSATGDQSEYAVAFAEGIRSVFSGGREEFEMEYPCHSPTESRWFVGRVMPFSNGSSPQAIVAHENITERKQMERQLEHLKQELEPQDMGPRDPMEE